VTDRLDLLRGCFRKALQLNDEETAGIDATTDVWSFPKWNSLGHIALILEIEKTFSVKFDESRTAELVSVEEILKAVDQTGKP